ncbi:MAG: hypothetical protein MH252_16985 [Thermosynechococcaceae cyanobacterium MS004]|nr:hypothetical protein [Thermosynechococcaceae cyanobacterium MS004]
MHNRNAARTVDPLYSTGLAMTALQIQQITEIVRRDLANTLAMDDVEVLSSFWCQLTARRQVDITDQYATMHDPFSAHLRRYWNLNGWWNGILPLWWSGFLTNPQGARSLIGLLQGGEKSERAAWDLFREVSTQIGAVEPQDFEQTFDFDQIINRRFDRSIDSIPQQLSRYFLWRLKIRFHLMKRLGWQQQLLQVRPLLQELTRMLAVKYLFRLKFRSLFQTINPAFISIMLVLLNKTILRRFKNEVQHLGQDCQSATWTSIYSFLSMISLEMGLSHQSLISRFLCHQL